MMEIDGRHTIKNKNKIFKKHARVTIMDVKEKQLLINQYVYSYYIVYVYMILSKYIVRHNMINVQCIQYTMYMLNTYQYSYSCNNI